MIRKAIISAAIAMFAVGSILGLCQCESEKRTARAVDSSAAADTNQSMQAGRETSPPKM